MKRLLLTEPTLLATAVRLTILSAVGFGLNLTPEQIVGLMAAVEAWMAVYARAAVVPRVRVEEREANATAAGVELGAAQTEAALRALAPPKKAAARKAAAPRKAR